MDPDVESRSHKSSEEGERRDDRKLDYDRRRDRSRSRERDRDRDRDRDREKSRKERSHSRERRRERERDSDRDSRHRSRRYDDYHGDSEGAGSREEAGSVIMLRNIPESVHKEDISRALESAMSYVRDVRLIQRRDGSQSFAFVEFYDTQDSSQWMAENKDSFELHGSLVNVEYSRSRREGRERSYSDDRDWVCFKCRTMNFARRRVCMTCECSRSESDSLHEDVRQGRLSDDRRDSDRDDKNPPSNVLIIKGLDALTNEDSVREAVVALSSHPLVDVRLIRDKATNTSRGFCFVELSTTDQARQLLEKMQKQYPAFFIDGKRVIMNYARQNNPPSSVKGPSTSVASAAIAQAQWSMAAQAQKAAAWRPQVSKELTYASQTAQPQKQQQQQQSGTVQTPQQACSADPKSESSDPSSKDPSSGAQPGPGQDLPSTYSYDATSGFYYDSVTGLYYDPKTQYHYNSQTGLYCYYDSSQQKYISVSSDGTPVDPEPSSANTAKADTKKKKDGSGGSISAKKIAKDMERWAKSVNAAKVAQQQQLQALIHQEVQTRDLAPSSTRDTVEPPAPVMVGVALSAALKNEEEDTPSLSTPAADVGTDLPGATSLPSGADPNPAHTDWSQLACLLCKRKFPSQEVLVKHQQFSELHKQNLAKEKAQLVTGVVETEPEAADIKYRDRAKERRDKFGLPDAIVPGWKRRLEREIAKGPPVPYEQPTQEGITDNNIGNKMLQAMGWSEGQGLGRANQGIREPIKAELRQQSAGLGAPGSKYGVYSSTGSYKDTLKQLTRARFQDTFNH